MRCFFTFILATLAIAVEAQGLSVSTDVQDELIVKSFLPNVSDLTARTDVRKDGEGNPCALVKVTIASQNVGFECGNLASMIVGDVNLHTNEYWVYLTAGADGAKHLKVKHPNFHTIDIVFADYGFRTLEPMTTYTLSITIPPKNNQPIQSLDFAIEKYKQQEYEIAFPIFQQYTSIDSIRAYAWLGRCFYYGFGTERNYELAFKYYQKSSDTDPIAMNGLGKCYMEGKGVKKDTLQAIKYWKKASDLGLGLSMDNLFMYYREQGDKNMSFSYAKQAYEAALEKRFCPIAVYYYDNMGDTNDISQVINNLEMGIKNNEYSCFQLYGILYSEGKGVTKSETKARQYWLEGAEHGDRWCMFNIACSYYFDNNKNTTEAKKWFKKAANLGVSESLYYLGNIALDDSDYDGALQYYMEAAEAGVLKAYNNIGAIYGRRSNLEAAKQWYKKAIVATGDDLPILNYAWTCYWLSEEDEAIKALQPLANKNNVEAQCLIGQAYMKKRDEEKAMQWLLKAANKNYAEAQRELAYLYQHYHGKENKPQMKYWILKAIKNGDKDAKKQYDYWKESDDFFRK